ncbi:hypothetical protein CsatB_003929 [Cannabis sativa]|uniref:uncharacterized protein LOC115715758 n=1 Tax=Cannabis sativa TaxID=3483 RepID=UPI0029CA7DD9|nr:uncharacterized protein LOC115715758 [Cannabis sativa]
MGTLVSLTTVIILSWILFSEAQGIRSARLLDLLIRDFTFKSLDTNVGTGLLHSVSLPKNFSGIGVNIARYRCGSLRRYGAQVKEFHLGIGVTIHPCVERVVLVNQNLGYNWSNIYYENYDLSGYQLVSPVLGLLAYNGGSDVNTSDPFEVGIIAGGKPISVNFSSITKLKNESGVTPLCAIFESEGKVSLTKQASPFVCLAKKNGHFGLVTEKPSPAMLDGNSSNGGKKESKWKVAVGSSIGAALGAFLLGLLLVAMFVRGKKRTRMEELERRAYEEEALQVSMVGHIRAPTASVTRTMPNTIEHEFKPPRRHR